MPYFYGENSLLERVRFYGTSLDMVLDKAMFVSTRHNITFKLSLVYKNARDLLCIGVRAKVLTPFEQLCINVYAVTR